MKHSVYNTLNIHKLAAAIICPPAATKWAEVIREDPLIPVLPSVCFLMSSGAIAQKSVHWWPLCSGKKCIVESSGN